MINKNTILKNNSLTFLKSNKLWFSQIQKCSIPKKYFLNNDKLMPAKIVICKLKNKSEIISQIFPTDSNCSDAFGYIDNTVMRNVLISETIVEENLQIIELEIYENDVKTFKNISVEINIENLNNAEIFDEHLLQLFIKNILQLLKFSSNCKISLKSLPHTCDISTISVKSTNCSPEEIGKIDDLTIVEIKNRIYVGVDHLHHTDLGGLGVIENELMEIIQQNVNYMMNGENSMFRPACQTLLIGPTGAGKTSVIHNLAIETKSNLFELISVDIWNEYPGETEKQLREIFQKIIKLSYHQTETVSILIIEDIDTLCPKVKTAENAHISRISSQLIALLDEITEKTKGIVIMATTKNIENLDLSLRRPGRLDREIFIKIPNENQRQEIANKILKSLYPQHKNEDEMNELSLQIAKRTSAFVGGDIALLIHTAIRIGEKKSSDLEFLSRKHIEEALMIVRPSNLRGELAIIEEINVNFAQLGGLGHLKKILDISILKPLQNPDAFKRFGLKQPKGILLYGPPGCAKTTIVKCLANETKMTLLSVSTAEVYSPYVGDAERFITGIFNQARLCTPSIIFLDEIDALIGSRSKNQKGKNDVQSRLLSVLLTEMDGIGLKIQSVQSAEANQVLVIAATNRPDMVDDALLRPGRFDKLIHIPAPDQNDRLEILEAITQKMPLDENINLEELSRRTENFSGADLSNLCNEAALHALTIDMATNKISLNNFENVLTSLKPSLTAEQINWYKKFESKMRIVT